MEWGGEFDHNPIMLEIKVGVLNPHSPFKFNVLWVSNLEFCELLKSCWVPMNNNEGPG